MITNEERDTEKAILEKEQKLHPELFQREPAIDSPEWMSHIGIKKVFGEYPLGYIRYLPQDFVVEEVALNKSIFTVDPAPLFQEPIEKGRLWEGELVKVDRSTLEAKDEIASLLQIPSSSIGWAGIKDRFAITSQLMSFSSVSDPQIFTKLDSEYLFLKNLKRGQNVLTTGKLWGNRFIITVRTPQPVTPKEKERIQESIQEIQRDGFWNFFSFQRFGTPRLNSHIAGKLLFQGAYEETVRSFLGYLSSREVPFFQNIRKEAEKQWRNWEVIRNMMSPFPSQFPSELRMLEYLSLHPGDFLGALKTIPDQVRLWVYAYASYLFNKKLSQEIQKEEVPVFLPLVTSPRSQDWELYKEFLKEDGVRLPSPVWRAFPFIRPASQEWSTLQKAEIHGVKFEEKIAAMAFSLPKGAYATSFLAHFFQLASHLPIVEGIDTVDIDAKEFLGLGSLRETLERFRPVIKKLQLERAGGEAEE